MDKSTGLVEAEGGYPVVGYNEINCAPLEEQAGDLVPDPSCGMQEGVDRWVDEVRRGSGRMNEYIQNMTLIFNSYS